MNRNLNATPILAVVLLCACQGNTTLTGKKSKSTESGTQTQDANAGSIAQSEDGLVTARFSTVTPEGQIILGAGSLGNAFESLDIQVTTTLGEVVEIVGNDDRTKPTGSFVVEFNLSGFEYQRENIAIVAQGNAEGEETLKVFSSSELEFTENTVRVSLEFFCKLQVVALDQSGNFSETQPPELLAKTESSATSSSDSISYEDLAATNDTTELVNSYDPSTNQVTLTASKTYNPSQCNNGEVDISEDLDVAIPESIEVIEGNAGNHKLTLRFSATLLCEYKGGSSQSNPAGDDQIALGSSYLFSSCNDMSVAGNLVDAETLRLKIDNGSLAFGKTVVQVVLQLQ